MCNLLPGFIIFFTGAKKILTTVKIYCKLKLTCQSREKRFIFMLLIVKR